ncbi:MAG: hypothetical protein ACRD50_17000 [Candidatus Acidiferrales bacterium]
MIKTRVFEKDGKWWFKWRSFAVSHELVLDLKGFTIKEEAEAARQKFEDERRHKNPWEPIVTE